MKRIYYSAGIDTAGYSFYARAAMRTGVHGEKLALEWATRDKDHIAKRDLPKMRAAMEAAIRALGYEPVEVTE